ncbi:MAG: hypothetical protein ACRD19_03445, partial [Terriglobia bacterium]
LDTWDRDQMFWAAKAPGAGNPNASGAALTTIAERDEERVFTSYGEIWARALKLMREDGVLERAVWIAPMNEVPWIGGRYLESIAALKKGLRSGGEAKQESARCEDAIYRRINNYMGAPIKAEIVTDRIPLSYCSLGKNNYAARVTDIYDVVDVHFMPEVILDAEDKRAFEKAGPGAPFGYFKNFEKFDLKAYSIAWDNACRDHYSAMLKQVPGFFKAALDHATLPSGKRLQVIVTEAFGPCFWPDSPQVDWEWYKRYNADALRIVAQMGITGATLSNYGEPLFTLWNDAGWHWAGNSYFRTYPTLATRMT